MMPAELGQLILDSIFAQASNLLHCKINLVASFGADIKCSHRTRAIGNQTSRQQGLLAVAAAHCLRQASCEADRLKYLRADVLDVPPMSRLQALSWIVGPTAPDRSPSISNACLSCLFSEARRASYNEKSLASRDPDNWPTSSLTQAGSWCVVLYALRLLRPLHSPFCDAAGAGNDLHLSASFGTADT